MKLWWTKQPHWCFQQVIKSSASSLRRGFFFGLIALTLSFLLSACGSKFGSIELEDVDTSLRQAQVALDSAYQTQAGRYALGTLKQAEELLLQAKQAKASNKGVEALRLAYEAESQARLAVALAQEIEQKADELAALQQEKESEMIALNTKLEAAEREASGARVEIQQLQQRMNQLEMNRQRISEAFAAQQIAEARAQQANAQLTAMQEELALIENQVRTAQEKQRLAEEQADQLASELTKAWDTAADMQEELSALQRRGRGEQRRPQTTERRTPQPKIDQKGSLERAQARAQAIAQARQYATRFQKTEEDSTSLSSQEKKTAQTRIDAWYLAWETANLNRHLSYYAPSVVGEQITIRSGREQKTTLSRSQLAAELSKEMAESWRQIKRGVNPEGNYIVATYRLRRPQRQGANSNQPSLYDIWVRDAWWSQIGSDWKITREKWRFYEAVPRH